MNFEKKHTISDVDCGALGYQEIECVYECCRGEPASIDGPGCDAEFEIVSAKIEGTDFDLVKIMSNDRYLELVEMLKEDLESI